MNQLALQVLIVVAFGAICFGCGYLTAFIMTRNKWRDEMIRRGAARYNSHKWEWGSHRRNQGRGKCSERGGSRRTSFRDRPHSAATYSLDDMRTAAALYLSALRLKSSACVWSRHAQASSSQKRAWACRASTMWQRSKLEWYGMRDLLFSAKRASSVCEGQARNNFLRI